MVGERLGAKWTSRTVVLVVLLALVASGCGRTQEAQVPPTVEPTVETPELSDAAVIDGELRQEVRKAILGELARCRNADGSFVDNPLIGTAPATGMAVLTLADLRDG